MRREADLYDFAAGNLRQIKVDIRTDVGVVPIQLSVIDHTIKMAGVVKAVHPDVHRKVMTDFGSRVTGGRWQDFTFNVEFDSFSAKQAATSWLRSAYLAFFAALGYRFIMRTELDAVRAKIRDPERDEPSTFRIIRPESSEPMLVRIEAPETFRSYVMFYRRNLIFLPRYNDHALYSRLAEHPETNVQFSGKWYPWPKEGPTFFHDRQVLVCG